MRGIYLRPLLAAIPTAAGMAVALASGARATSWFELLAAGALITVSSVAVAFFVCLTGEHRALIWSILLRRLVTG